MKTALNVILAYGAAVATTTILGTVVQTQFNLAALQSLGVSVPLGVRIETTWHDLLGFTPSFGPIVAAGFLVAFLLGALVLRWLSVPRDGLYALGGAIAIGTALVSMNVLFQITAVAAARGTFGFACLVLSGAVGGWIFATLSRSRAV